MFPSVVINGKKVSTFLNALCLHLKGSLPGKRTYPPAYDMPINIVGSLKYQKHWCLWLKNAGWLQQTRVSFMTSYFYNALIYQLEAIGCELLEGGDLVLYLCLGILPKIRSTVKYFIILYMDKLMEGLPTWLSGKEPACQCRRFELDPWVRKILCRSKWQPTPVLYDWEILWTEEPGGI